jgi:hypothetical protein
LNNSSRKFSSDLWRNYLKKITVLEEKAGGNLKTAN